MIRAAVDSLVRGWIFYTTDSHDRQGTRAYGIGENLRMLTVKLVSLRERAKVLFSLCSVDVCGIADTLYSAKCFGLKCVDRIFSVFRERFELTEVFTPHS